MKLATWLLEPSGTPMAFKRPLLAIKPIYAFEVAKRPDLALKRIDTRPSRFRSSEAHDPGREKPGIKKAASPERCRLIFRFY
jgi:hypothetical protein